jgi:hypothetical protein
MPVYIPKSAKVTRVRLDRGGYATNYVRGHYFGLDGGPLFAVDIVDTVAHNGDERMSIAWVRACSYQEVRGMYKNKGYKVAR